MNSLLKIKSEFRNKQANLKEEVDYEYIDMNNSFNLNQKDISETFVVNNIKP